MMGYREQAHTGDWALEVWAPDILSLLEIAARGMYALMGVRLVDLPHQQRGIHLRANDSESLLVAFLSELLYLSEIEHLGFHRFNLSFSSGLLQGSIEGSEIIAQSKEIKGVTFHRLKVRQEGNILRTILVFDV